MDEEKLKYFVSRYKELDGDELIELHNRRDTLTEEALLALDATLQGKGLNTDILSRFSAIQSEKTSQPELEPGQRLSQSILARVCRIAFILPIWLPVQHVISRSEIQIGGIWAGLLAGILFYVGYRIGDQVTLSVCNSDNITFQKKKLTLWLLLIGAVIVYFILHVFAESLVIQ